MEGWGVQGKLRNMLKHVPNNKMVHHPLACRSPLSKWLSQGKRTIVIGDAAHPFLPVIGQGASQAIEDAAVVAISLELSGKNNVPLAFQIAEMIR
jgi:2-polyprenyl-6-methoxyphenol hydroxylase-like FAD-dependent oxidoreductase